MRGMDVAFLYMMNDTAKDLSISDEKLVHMKFEKTNRHCRLRKRDLLAFEALIGVQLPDDYRVYLHAHNGGRPVPSDFKFLGRSSGSSLHHMYGLFRDHECDLRSAFECFRDRIPSSLIPIADDPFGNQICLGIQGTHYGKIFFWDHERESRRPSFRNIRRLADSFGTFVGALYQWADPDETAIERAIKKDDVEHLQKLLPKGADLEYKDEYGRTMIENAAIHNSLKAIAFLHARGAKLRKALALAEANAEFFPEHRKAIRLIKSLGKQGR
jgi:hypothetical protein